MKSICSWHQEGAVSLASLVSLAGKFTGMFFNLSSHIEPISTSIITPCHINNNAKLHDLEITIDQVIKQLNNHFEFQIKTDKETFMNIYDIISFTMKTYDLDKNETTTQ